MKYLLDAGMGHTVFYKVQLGYSVAGLLLCSAFARSLFRWLATVVALRRLKLGDTWSVEFSGARGIWLRRVLRFEPGPLGAQVPVYGLDKLHLLRRRAVDVGRWAEPIPKSESRLERLYEAVLLAEPLLRHYENQLASSLSCDTRSHDDDREPRKRILSVLAALKEEKDSGSKPVSYQK